MAAVVDICNRALQKLGAKRIVSLSQDTPNARSCGVAYPALRDAELAAHPWSFAVTRAELAAISPAPDFGRANAFELPADFLMLLSDYSGFECFRRDWEIEGQQIMSDDVSPIQIRYTVRITDSALFTPLFCEALSARMAVEMCEEITQSNTKKAALLEEYRLVIREARRNNAIQKPPVDPVTDDWIRVRF